MEKTVELIPMKRTQRDVSNQRGKAKQIYIKPDIEKRALKFCEDEKLTISLLIRLALIEYLDNRGL